MRLRIASLLLLTIFVLAVAGGEEHVRKNGKDIKETAPVLASDQSKPQDNAPPALPRYSNGPVNGTITGWQINGGFAVSDSMLVTNPASLPVNITFGDWIDAGNPLCIPATACIPTFVEVSISDTGYFGNELYEAVLPVASAKFHNFVIPPLPPGSPCVGFCVVYSVTVIGPNVSLPPDNFYLTLSNAVTKAPGGPVYWDENNGIGCPPQPGCPSTAQENAVGNIPSESFTFQ
jgi:hypothetical protein